MRSYFEIGLLSGIGKTASAPPITHLDLKREEYENRSRWPERLDNAAIGVGSLGAGAAIMGGLGHGEALTEHGSMSKGLEAMKKDLAVSKADFKANAAKHIGDLQSMHSRSLDAGDSAMNARKIVKGQAPDSVRRTKVADYLRNSVDDSFRVADTAKAGVDDFYNSVRGSGNIAGQSKMLGHAEAGVSNAAQKMRSMKRLGIGGAVAAGTAGLYGLYRGLTS